MIEIIAQRLENPQTIASYYIYGPNSGCSMFSLDSRSILDNVRLSVYLQCRSVKVVRIWIFLYSFLK